MRYLFKGANQTAASPTLISLAGTTIKTLLQVKPGATIPLKIFAWGISFKGFAAAEPVRVELIEVDVTATVTAAAAADLTKYNAAAIAGGDPTTAIFAVGTTSTGYNASAEGTVTALRDLDAPQLIAPTNQYIMQFAEGREPLIQLAKFARIRAYAPAAVDCYPWMIVGPAT